MKVSSKHIIVNNSFSKLKNKTTGKEFLKLKNYQKKDALIYSLSKEKATSINKLKSINIENKINFFKATYFNHIPQEAVIHYESAIHKFNQGFNMFSCSFDLSKFVNIYEGLPNYNLDDPIDYSNKKLSVFFKNTIYEYETDNVPYYYKNLEGYKENMIIVNSYYGNSYVPEYNYDGIGVIQQREGYKIKTGKDLYFKGKAEYENSTKFDLSYYSNDLSVKLADIRTTQHKREIENGWYMIGCPSKNNLLISSYFEDLINKNQIRIIKRNDGEVVTPEYNYIGFEYLEPFNGYQIKFQNL